MKNTEIMSGGLLTVNEACSFLKMSRPTVYRWMKLGLLPYTKLGSARRVPRKALELFAAARTVGKLTIY